MCYMDIDRNNSNEQTTVFSISIYAVDEHGICHLFENRTFGELEMISLHSEEKMSEESFSKSTVVVSTEANHSLPLTNENVIQSSSSFHSDEYLSTQPFSIFDIHENNLSSLRLFNNNISTPILSSPLQLSGHIASQYQNISLSNSDHDHSMMNKRKKKKLRYHVRRRTNLKKQLKLYLKKKKKKQQQYHSGTISNIIVHEQVQQIELLPNQQSFMNDLELVPDLSRRKYIYKDVTLTSNNQNQMNWRIFQCTQQSSAMQYLDQSITHDGNYRPCDFINTSISLPDIRVGLSRHHSIKQLHKTIIDS